MVLLFTCFLVILSYNFGAILYILSLIISVYSPIFICLSVYLSVCMYVRVYLCVYSYIHPSTCIYYICLSIYASTSVFVVYKEPSCFVHVLLTCTKLPVYNSFFTYFHTTRTKFLFIFSIHILQLLGLCYMDVQFFFMHSFFTGRNISRLCSMIKKSK